MQNFDVAIIGAGPAGFAAAMRALDFDKTVALIEKDRIGGAGLWDGALSSKTFWELSEYYKVTKKINLGFSVYDSDLRYNSVMNEVRTAVTEKYLQMKAQIDYYQKQGRLFYYNGFASLQSRNVVNIRPESGFEHVISADNIILAMGSRPRKLPHIPIDEEVIVTSDGIEKFNDFPESIVILGAGVIGCEYATILSNFGRTKVSIIDKEDRILPFEDEDISYFVAGNLEDNGVVIHRGSQLVSMEITDGAVEYKIRFADGREETHQAEKALVSVGRVPNLEGVGLEQVGIKTNERGLFVDGSTRTNIDNIYAVGDLSADISLVNIGTIEGRHAIEKMYGNSGHEMKYDNISSIMFLNPEIATVGLNEEQARSKGIAYRVAKLDFSFISRAIAMRKTKGFFKILVTDDDDMKVLGMRVIGGRASATLETIAILMEKGLSIKEVAEISHPHPSITEGLQECARMLIGTSTYKAEVFNYGIKCYRVSAEGRFENLY